MHSIEPDTNVLEVVSSLEDCFTQMIKDYHYDWSEDAISHRLMIELRKMFVRKEIRYKGFTKIVDWFSYKNTKKGSVEPTYGDIALIVNVQFSSGERLTGIGFLEAKRTENNALTFPAIKREQMKTTVSNNPYSHMLYYLKRKTSVPLRFPGDDEWTSVCWASPINTAIQKLSQITAGDHSKLLRISLPFSQLLVSRYFWGLDLDYRKESLQDVLMGMNDAPPPDFLAVINVYYEGQRPIAFGLGDNCEAI